MKLKNKYSTCNDNFELKYWKKCLKIYLHKQFDCNDKNVKYWILIEYW